MRRPHYLVIVWSIVLSFISDICHAQQPITVGIPRHKMNYVAAPQMQSQWCWAACIQMIFRYYGVSISQEKIVARTYGSDAYGSLPNWPGSWQAITANLNNWDIDSGRQYYAVGASFSHGIPDSAGVIDELRKGHPIILAYASGPNSGHAVVLTGVSYINSYSGPIITTAIVRDPWPSPENIANSGRVEWSGSQLASLIQGYWIIRVLPVD